MTTTSQAFAVDHEIHGMNTLAEFLNASNLAGGWHFAAGTRFDQTQVTINFDDPADAAPSLQRYRASRFIGPLPHMA